MAIGRLFVCGMLILAVVFIGQIALPLVPLAVAQGPGDSGQTQGARIYYQYLPLVGRDYCSNCYLTSWAIGNDTRLTLFLFDNSNNFTNIEFHLSITSSSYYYEICAIPVS